MASFVVGELFDKDITSYRESVKMDITNKGIELCVFFSNPTQDEIEAFEKGEIQVRILEIKNIIFMFFKFGSLHWMDVPYTINLSKYLSKSIDICEKGIGLGLHIYLTDAQNGILKVLRIYTMDTEHSNYLINYMEKQKDENFNVNEYDRLLGEIYNKYSIYELLELSK